MRIRPWIVGLALFGVTALSAAVVAQDEKDKGKEGQQSPEEVAAMMQEWMQLMQPGEHHKHLEYFVGKWKTESKVYMGGPGTPPMVSEGASEMKWVLGGRFLQDEYKGSMMGQPYEGIGLRGYNNYRNMYTSIWISSMGTEMLTMTGMRHPKTGVFTYYGEMDEPTLKVTGRTVKYVTRIIDKDSFVFEIFDLHAGDDYKVIEINYKRHKDN